MPKVALIFPHFRTKASTEMLFPPLGLASLAAHLKLRNFETRIFDCTFQSFGSVKKALIAYQPDLVGITSMILLHRNTFRFAELVRQRLPNTLLVVGGSMPTLYPERFAEAFDLVFRGESDLCFPDFCQEYFNRELDRKSLYRMDLAAYPGLYGRNLDLQVDNPVVHYTEQQMLDFPLPYRGGFDHPSYQHAWVEKDGTKTTSIMVTVGCPFDCDFCSRPVFGRLYRKRNLEVVFEEIAQLKQLGYDHLWIADDNFTLDLPFVQEFSRRMVGQGMAWSCLSRSTGITPEIARQMKDAGCDKVYLGLESGCDDTLKMMNKRASVADGVRAVEVFKHAGVKVAAFFIVGYPGETMDAFEETFNLSLRLPLDEISFNVPFPLPGSDLFERVSGIDPDKDWQKENDITFVYSSQFDPRWIKRRIRQTMKAFAEKKINNPPGE